MEKQTIDTPEPTREDRIAALPTLPERSRYIYNRTSMDWEGMFDGRVYVLKPHEIKPVDSAIAEHLWATSMITGTLRRLPGGGGTLTAERAIALGPGWAIAGSAKIQDDFVLQYEEATSETMFLVPTTTQPGLELFDRSSIPNYTDRPNLRDPGKPMHSEIVRV